MTADDPLDELIRHVDALESAAASYVTLDDLQVAAEVIETARAGEVLLVDYRTRFDAATGQLTPVTLCRLNRHHPRVRALTGAE